MAEATYCDDCGRNELTGCACSLTFAQKLRGVQVDRHSLKTSDVKRKDPKNRGLGWDGSK